MSIADQRQIRNDGKPRRKPRLGIPPASHRPSADAEGPAPMWHELVQPGPKGSQERRAERLTAQHHGVLIKQAEGPGQRRERRVTRRANGMLGEQHSLIVTRSPHGAPVPGAAVGMARIRAYRNPPREGALTAKQRREARQLSKIARAAA